MGVWERIPEKGASTTGLRRPGSGGDVGRVTGRGTAFVPRPWVSETEGGQQASGHLQVKADDAGL